MNNDCRVIEIIHFLDIEIEKSRERMLEYGECFDGVKVNDVTRKELLKSHIRFCKHIKNILTEQ